MVWAALAFLIASLGAVALFAWNIPLLWTAAAFAAGALSGGILASGNGRWAYLASIAASGILLSAVLVRALPLHAMAWKAVDKAVCSRGEERFTITDPKELETLLRFGASGRFRSMIKSGYGWQLELTSGGHTWRVYLHGDGFGYQPGGFVQTIFVPAEPGLRAWFEGLTGKRGT